MRISGIFVLVLIYFMAAIPSMLLLQLFLRWLDGLRAKRKLALALFVAVFFVLFTPGMLATDFFHVPAPLIVAVVLAIDLGPTALLNFQLRYLPLILWGGGAAALLGLFLGWARGRSFRP